MISESEANNIPHDITNNMALNQETNFKLNLNNATNSPFKDLQNFAGEANEKFSLSKKAINPNKSASKLSVRKLNQVIDDENDENIPLNPLSKKIGKLSTAKKSITKDLPSGVKDTSGYGSLVDRLFQSQARENIRSKLELNINQTSKKKGNDLDETEEPPVERDLVKAIELAASLKKDSKSIITEEQERTEMSPLSEIDKLKLVAQNSGMSDGLNFPEMSVDRRISLDSLLLQSSGPKDIVEESKEPIIQLTPLPVDDSLLVEATPAQFRPINTSTKKKVEFKPVIHDTKEYDSPSTNQFDPRFKTPSNRKTFRLMESSSAKRVNPPVNDTPFHSTQAPLDPSIAASLSLLKDILPINIENGQLQLTLQPGTDVSAILSIFQTLSQNTLVPAPQNPMSIPDPQPEIKPELVAVPIKPDIRVFMRKDRRSSSSKKLCPDHSGVKRTSNYKSRKNKKNMGPCDPNSKIDPEKLLGMSLGELSQNSYQPSDGLFKFLDRASSIHEAEQKHAKEGKTQETGAHDYSQNLEIGPNNGQDTPISKTLKQTLQTAGELNSTIQNTIDAFQRSLEKAKKKLLGLQPSYRRSNFFENIEEVPEKQEQENIPKKDIEIPDDFKALPEEHKNDIQPELKQEAIVQEDQLSSQISLDNSRLTKANSNESQVSKNNILDTSVLWNLIRNRPKEEVTYERIKEIAKREFNVRDLDPFQLDCVRSILNKKSCIFRTSTQKSKSLTFQISALMAQGLIVYVHSALPYMINQIQGLVPSLSGACINNLLSREEINRIVGLIKSNQVKILFISPEKFISENLVELPEISFVCLDEAHYVPTISSNFRLSHLNVFNHLKTKLPFVPVMCLVPPIAFETCVALAEMFSIDENSIFPKEYFNSCHFDITISRDDDKMRALINFLSRLRANNTLNSIIIYTESRKSVEDLAGVLPRNGGFKTYPVHNGKKEAQKLEMINSFLKNPGGIIVTTSNTDLGIDRNLIKGVIHYCLPKSLEVYIQEISHLNEKAFCHMFLHDEDYYRARQTQNADLLEVSLVIKFAERVYEARSHNKESNGSSRFTTSQKLKKESNPNFIAHDGPMLNLLLKTKEEHSQKSESEEDRNAVYSMKISEICSELDLKKEIIIELFEKFQSTSDWLEFCGANEETFYYKIIKDVHPFLIKDCAEKVFEKINREDVLSLNKLDLVYAISKKCAFQSIEHLYKQTKFDNNKLLTTNTNIKNSTFKDSNEKDFYYSAQKKNKLNLIEFFEKYLNYKDAFEIGYGVLVEISGNTKLRDLVPLTKLQTLKDKNNVITDITSLIGELCDEISSEPDSKSADVNTTKVMLTRNIVKILQGIPLVAGGKEYRSNKCWDKYYRCDYRELFDVVYEGLSNYTHQKLNKKGNNFKLL